MLNGKDLDFDAYLVAVQWLGAETVQCTAVAVGCNLEHFASLM
jgi:hypothetical protein